LIARRDACDAELNYRIEHQPPVNSLGRRL